MEKFKASDTVIIKDHFLKSFEIYPVEISGQVEDESQKKFGDYYISNYPYQKMVYETNLITVEELGKVEIGLTDGEYSYLQYFFQDLVDNNSASKVTDNHFHYGDLDVSLKSNLDAYSISVKLMSGGLRNIIYLGIEIGRFFESQKREIEISNEKNFEIRRHQDNENANFNRRWNDEQRNR